MLNGIEMKSPGQVLRALDDARRRGVNLWDNARFVLADVPLNPQEVSRILPWGMRLSPERTGTLFIVDYTKTAFTGAYKEAALLIRVQTPLGAGLHCCWMLVDDDTALIYGRELLGYPKKMAEFEFEESERGIRASVARRGVKVLSMEAERGSPHGHPEPIFAHKTFNVGAMGQFFMLNPIWLFKPKEVIHESNEARVSIRVAESDYDPISKLIAGDPVRGRTAVIDIPSTRAVLLPVGVAGPRWFVNTFYLRYR